MAGVIPGGSGVKQPSGFKAGNITVGTSAIQGPDIAVATGHKVVLACPSTNSNSVWVGDSNVAVGNGMEITPGGGAAIAVDNLNKLWFISDADGQTVGYAVEVA